MTLNMKLIDPPHGAGPDAYAPKPRRAVPRASPMVLSDAGTRLSWRHRDGKVSGFYRAGESEVAPSTACGLMFERPKSISRIEIRLSSKLSYRWQFKDGAHSEWKRARNAGIFVPPAAAGVEWRRES